MLPDISADKLREALQRFDAELRPKEEWRTWQESHSHRYAILDSERFYPVKQVVSLATGVPTHAFSGGQEANTFVRARGLSVVPLRNEVRMEAEAEPDLAEALESILAGYAEAKASGKFSSAHPIWARFTEAASALRKSEPVLKRSHLKVEASAGKGLWASVPWIALLDDRETTTTRDGVYVVYLFRADMKGVYLTFNQGVTVPTDQLGRVKARALLQERAAAQRPTLAFLTARQFALDSNLDLGEATPLGDNYRQSTIAHRYYEAGKVPDTATLLVDLEAALKAYDSYLAAKASKSPETKAAASAPVFRLGAAVERLAESVRTQGFVFEPWQVATYVTALRTKPFVILAGVSGTGKSHLPTLVAKATGGESRLIPVRPDWTDSSDVLGYVDLQGAFRPGPFLEFARSVGERPQAFGVCVVDEMNLARVEQYFAEVLSRIEDRSPAPDGGYQSEPVCALPLTGEAQAWSRVRLPPNLALVGTVNMDETTHGFSRKVLDRAFTLEVSDVDLRSWETPPRPAAAPTPWPVSAWRPRAIRLGELGALAGAERKSVVDAIEELALLNTHLAQAQLQVGYRVRDEVCLFLLHAQEVQSSFVTRKGEKVSPLDVAIQMKILPRLVGGGDGVRRTLLRLLGWARTGKPLSSETEALAAVDDWNRADRPFGLEDAKYPRTTARLCLMWERLQSEGFTSYWL